MYQLLTSKDCHAKAFYDDLNLGFKKGKKTDIKRVIRSMIKEKGFKILGDVDSIVEEALMVDDTPFSGFFDKDESITNFTEALTNLYSLASVNGYSSYDVGEVISVKTAYKNITVPIHFYLENGGNIYAVYFEMKKPSYTVGVGTKKYYAEDELMYLLYLALQKGKYPNAIPAVMFLYPQGSNKKGKFDFTQFYYYDYRLDYSLDNLMEMRINSLASVICSSSEKTDSTACNMCQYRYLCKMENNNNVGVEELVEEVKKASGKIKFTPAQQEVIDFKKGEMRVIAGAGAGKTTCLVNRVINLLKTTDTKAYQVLFITFTVHGTVEIREKLEYWRKKESLNDDSYFSVETFNSFGQKLLEKHYKKLGYEDMPYLIDDLTAYDILSELSQRGVRVPGFSYTFNDNTPFTAKNGISSLYQIISNYKEETSADPFRKVFDLDRYEGVLDKIKVSSMDEKDLMNTPLKDLVCKEFKQTVEEYNKILEEEGLIDYADQIRCAVELLKMPEIQNELKKYKHIIVDEFQDTSLSNMQMVQLLYHQEPDNSLLVCGDDAQAIFGFRGVGPENILNFKEYYPNAKDVFLVDNFRSTNQIVGLANKVIALNKKQIKKDLIAHKDGPKVEIYDGNKENAENIANKIIELVNEGVALQDIGVLMGTRFELLKLRSLLYKAGIANVLSVSERYIDDSSVIGAYSLASFINDPTYYLGYLTYKVSKDISYRDHINEKEVKEEADKLAMYLADLSEGGLFDAYINEILSLPESDAIKELTEYFKTEFKTFKECYRYLTKMIKYQSGKSTEGDCKNYKAINISTIHSSKGREFEYVIISNEKINSVVGGHAIGDDVIIPEFNEERIRLYYVAITRAKKKLMIYQDYQISDNTLNELTTSNLEQFKKAYGNKKVTGLKKKGAK